MSSPRQAAAEEPHGAIGARLRAPAETLDLDGFAAVFHTRRIEYLLPGLAPHARDPGLAGRIRGAFGDVLVEASSPESAAGMPCPWDPPCAFEALFRKQGRMTPGSDFPSPWVISLDPRHGDLTVTLTLFGFATEWAPAAAEMLAIALCRRVDWRGRTELFVPRVEIARRRLLGLDGVRQRAGEETEPLTLDFLSPLVSSGASVDLAPAAAFSALGFRLEGIARWHGATLSAVDWAGIAAALRRAEWTWLSVERVTWSRGSRRQDNKRIPMTGITGRLLLEGEPQDIELIAPLVRLGEHTHVGADIAFGCGRYRLISV